MSELPLTPFAAPPGLTMVGDQDTAGVCVDGVCAVPQQAASPPATSPDDAAAAVDADG